MQRGIVVIPTYNEAENLPLIVPKVLERDERLEVLVVDDDSPDGTGQIADDLAAKTGRVHVCHRKTKEGLGAAYREGLAKALELGADFIIQMDADFSHPPETIDIMLEEIAEHDIVMGSRYLKGITVVNWPIERILISYFANLYVRKVTALPISDATSGFRCMRRQALIDSGFDRSRSNGYAFQIEMHYRFVKKRARIKEIPFFFLDRIRGDSKLDIHIGLEALWMVWWLRFADAVGKL